MCSFAYVSAYDAHIFTGRVCPPDGRSSQDSTALGSGWNTHSEADSDRSARLHGRRSATGVGFSRSAEAAIPREIQNCSSGLPLVLEIRLLGRARHPAI